MFRGGGGLNVVRIGNLTLGNLDRVTLEGGPRDVFVLNVTGEFEMSDQARIVTGDGVDPSHVLINVIGAGPIVSADDATLIEGTILAPDRSLRLHDIIGAAIGGSAPAGGRELSFDDGAIVTLVTFNPCSPVPDPRAFAVLAPVFLLLMHRPRRARR